MNDTEAARQEMTSRRDWTGFAKGFVDWLFAPRPLLDAWLGGVLATFCVAFLIVSMWWKAAVVGALAALAVSNARTARRLIEAERAFAEVRARATQQERDDLVESIKKWHDELRGNCGINWQKAERIRVEMLDAVAPLALIEGKDVEWARKQLGEGF